MPVVELKARVQRYFDQEAEEYTARHYFEAKGGVLWARHRAILQLIDALSLPAGAQVLDLGCGPGLLTVALARRGFRGVGIDVAPGMVEHCRVQAVAEDLGVDWRYELGDAEAISQADNSFDVVIAAGVIEYLASDDIMLSEVRRVLKPRGAAILNVTNRCGYSDLLTPLLHRLKRNSKIRELAACARRLAVGGHSGPVAFDFSPRKHSQAGFRENLHRHGFEVLEDRYLKFTLLPAPFCTLTSRVTQRFEDWLDILDRSWLRRVGSCYLVAARKL